MNSAASFDTLTKDVKELIPAPDLRRRMSRVVRMGVAAAMEALAQLPDDTKVDAIITATRMGCLADSEKFLHSVLADGTLSPTPFIQSTFNTVGAQVALLTKNHCYNMTHVHGSQSLQCALVDAAMQMELCGAEHVLVGLFDEITPTLEGIKERMRGVDGLPAADGAWFFVISKHPLAGCLAEMESLVPQNFEQWLR